MQVPTDNQVQSQQGNLLFVQANPAEYGGLQAGALEHLGESMRGDANEVLRGANAEFMRRQHAKAIDDQRWANEQYLANKDTMSKFTANPDVFQSEQLPDLIKKQAQDQLQSVDATKAPSPEAYQQFRQMFTSFAGSKVDASYEVSYNNKVNNTVNSVGEQTNAAIGTYRDNKHDPTALSDLTDSVAAIRAFNENSFRKNAPGIANKLNTDLTTQTVMAVMGDNPAAAAAFLNSDKSIDEQVRRRLQDEINTAAHTKDNAEIFQFHKATEDVINAAKAGNVTENPFSLDHYKGFYPADMAAVHKQEDDDQIKVYADGNDILKNISAQYAPYQQQVLNSLNDKTKMVGDQATYRQKLAEFVSGSIAKNIELQGKDTAAWLQANNPQVKKALDDVATASPANSSAALKTLSDTQLLYQGAAPEGASAADKHLYLNKSQNDFNLLSNDVAEKEAAKLNSASPQEFIKKTGELLSQYPDEKAQMVVFNDLVTKGKLSQQYQFAWLNKDQWWVDSYLGAVKAGKDITLPEKSFKELEGLVENNPSFVNLRSTMIGDDNQRSSEITGFREGIQQWAKVLASQRKSPKEAVNLAAGKLIDTSLGFTKVNDKPLMILRDQGTDNQGNKLPPRTDAQVEDIGRRLGFVPQFLPLNEIDQRPFTALQGAGTEGRKQEALSDEINARGFWQTTNDGKGASLYCIDENGVQPFQVRDTKGQPFVVKFNNLPAFQPQLTTTTSGIPGQGERTVKEIPGVRTSFMGSYHAKHPGVTENNLGSRPSWLTTE